MSVEQNRYVAKFDRGGTYPIEVHFNAAVTQSNDWSAVDFRVATSALQPVVLQGLAADTEFQFASAARPERTGTNFVSYLPVDGSVKFAWKQSRPEAEGKLFYAAEMISQISVSPGLMRQAALAQRQDHAGRDEQPRAAAARRRRGHARAGRRGAVVERRDRSRIPPTAELVVQFNQPQKDAFAIFVQMQTPLGAFPQSADAMQVQPEGATRFAGTFRIVNDGAVRLEVAQASGLSQISPEQFPEADVFRATGSQRFAYRFSSADFALKIQADQILPEIGVSEVLAYNLGENELVGGRGDRAGHPRGAAARDDAEHSEGLRRRAAQGVGHERLFHGRNATTPNCGLSMASRFPTGRSIQLRLERNQPLGETNWTLPRIEVAKAKSVRGFVGVSADNGFRLTAERTQALTEIATAFFPKPLAGIQAAFRVSDPDWSATLRVERLPQTVQADVFHLFSIGEGIAYGSSVMNYVISGAPVSAFRVELSDEYYNVEFTGKDIRNWEKTTNGYVVQLNTPVSGAYTLLATYERPFKPQGETLAFTGARPLDAQSESGHTIIISAYQFQVKPVDVSPGLLALEPGEVPPEYRLFFDKPVLAAYRYSSRPFDLKLALSPLAQGDSLAQVVDRASLTTQISKEGQALTDARYFVKSRGNPNFRVTLPAGTELWSATGQQRGGGAGDGRKIQSHSAAPARRPGHGADAGFETRRAFARCETLNIAAPVVAAPVMLAEWQLTPDDGQRLVYRSGTLAPAGGTVDMSGFAQVAQLARNRTVGAAVTSLAVALGFAGAGAFSCGAGRRAKASINSACAICSARLIGLAAVIVAAILLVHAARSFESITAVAPDTDSLTSSRRCSRRTAR